MDEYLPYSLLLAIERETDSEFSPELWRDDPDMDQAARVVRDGELFLDLLGNLDSSCA